MRDPEREFDLTVVIPVLNGADHIRETLGSLASQETEARWEVVVADNGSTDRTPDLVREHIAIFPVPMRLVDASASKGAAFACNAGAVAARGEGIAFCAADDRVGERWVEAAVAGLKRADAVCGPLHELTTPHNPSSAYLRDSAAVDFRGRRIVIGTGNLAIRRDVFMAVGGLDTSMRAYGGEDNEFALRLDRAGITPTMDDDLILYFRKTENPRAFVRKLIGAGAAEAVLWRKHPEHYPVESSWTWYPKVILEYPPSVVRELRRRNSRGLARFTFRRLGNVIGRAKTRRGVAPAQLIDTVQPPRDLSTGS